MLRKLGKLFFYTFTGFVSVVFAAILSVAVIIAVKTKDGPLDLAFLKPSVNHWLSKTNKDITFDDIVLHWQSLDAPIIFKAKNVSIRDHGEEVFGVEQLDFVFPLTTVFESKGVPSQFVINGLRYTVKDVRASETNLSLEAMNAFDIDFEEINKYLMALSYMKRLSLKNATITMVSGKTQHQLVVDGELTQSKKARHGKFTIDIINTSSTIDMVVDMHAGSHDVKVNFYSQDLNSQTFYALLGMNKEQAKQQVLQFQNSNITFDYTLNLKTKQHRGLLTTVLDHVIVREKSLWKKPLQVPDITFDTIFSGHDIQVKPFEVSINDVKFMISANGKVSKDHKKMPFLIDVKTKTLSFDKVPGLWPKGAAEGARDWITTNIKAGDIPMATCIMSAEIGFDKSLPLFSLKKLGGDIHIENTELTYHKDMLSVTNLKAHAKYDHDHFSIKILEGTHNGLALSKGLVTIGQFSDPVSTLSIKSHIDGDLKGVMEIIDQPSLGYGRKIGVQAEHVSGDITGVFTMSFPLLSPFDTSKIVTGFQGQVTKTKLDAYQSLPIEFAHGDLKIDMQPEGIMVEGVGKLSELPASVRIAQTFATNATNVKIDTLLCGAAMQRLVTGLDVLFQGQAPTTFTFQSSKDQQGQFHVQSDLTKVALNTLIMKKAEGIQGKLVFSAHYEGDTLVPSGPVSYQDQKGWKIDVAMPNRIFALSSPSQSTDPNMVLQDLSFGFSSEFENSPVVGGTVTVAGSGVTKISLDGKSMDIKTFMETDLKGFESKSHADQDNKSPMIIDVKADRITNGNHFGVVDSKLHIEMQKGKMHVLTYQGSTQEGVGTNRTIQAEMFVTPKGVRKLRLQTEQGGALLRALGVFENIRGGQLEFVAHNDPHFRSDEWIGKVRMRSFDLLETPFVARLLSLIPSGTSALTENKGLKMDVLKMRFGLSDSELNIHGLRAHGVSTGFSLTGVINRIGEKLVNIQGTLVPLRPLNALLSHIPLVGTLITGGKNEGLFSVNFGVGGNMDAPKVSSNPMSVLAPGIMKRILANGSDTMLVTDDWLNSDDKSGDIFDQEFLGLEMR